MSVAGVVVVPARKGYEKELAEKLGALQGVCVHGIGEKGIAVVLEAESLGQIKRISEEISEWTEVAGFHLAYVNRENPEDGK